VRQDKAEQAPLSVHRAFVVHFWESNDVAHRQMSGRVEHVVSGQSAHFVSLEDLLDFIARVLPIVQGPPQPRVKKAD
jgi:hypothetical protein